ncbi:regulator of cell cycle RGCC [Scleropages formosus]|uniref:regulator of cell cycle RGCC n=1 Tax=Scleropages formosus TaxID=113540 RepID=UPI000878C9FD|nr:regulator of cell cycle RGCC-like [Scleropages formosus]
MTSCNSVELEVEFGDLLQEFQHVLEELRVPTLSTPCIYEQHLEEAKRRAAMNDRVSDSGIEDSDCSREQSPGSSLNTSEEELSTAGVNVARRAKLGDTRDLQSFIENLDKELAEM